jgi:hypothetical protein
MRKIMADRTTLPERVLDDPDILLAIGQHYGIGTRLLDWTLDPAIALYFAVSECIRQPPEQRSDAMSVFAMAAIYLNIGGGQAKADLVFPPRTANPNLVAQKGLLTKITWNAPDLWDQDRAQLTADPVGNVPTARIDARLIRLDLPQAQASAAMKMLFDAKIDASVLFPSHHGLARTAEDLVRSGRMVASQQFDRTVLYIDMNDKSDVSSRPSWNAADQCEIDQSRRQVGDGPNPPLAHANVTRSGRRSPRRAP